MKTGDLVTFKSTKLDSPDAVGIIMHIEMTDSVSFGVWVSWNFLAGDIKRHFNWQLKNINKQQTNKIMGE